MHTLAPKQKFKKDIEYLKAFNKITTNEITKERYAIMLDKLKSVGGEPTDEVLKMIEGLVDRANN